MELSSKLSLYDTLAILTTGFMILLLLIPYIENISFINGILFFIASYIIGLIYNKLIEDITNPCLRNNKGSIKKAYEKIKMGVKNKDILKYSDSEHYYGAYYLLAEKNLLMNIPVLEAQTAFLRNIFFLLIIYLVAILTGDSAINNRLQSLSIDKYGMSIGLIITIMLLLYLWSKIQMKIYELIWEGYYFCEMNRIAEKQT